MRAASSGNKEQVVGFATGRRYCAPPCNREGGNCYAFVADVSLRIVSVERSLSFRPVVAAVFLCDRSTVPCASLQGARRNCHAFVDAVFLCDRLSVEVVVSATGRRPPPFFGTSV
ncbi:hypothetical protein CBR_g30585 [Chara braunii]|uniref:Uncharacterized protein n=1 Tax=Chara braunii TaxID=69332 RepID=A0A388LD43_CHABU|nr:hypothetical protein CBR_g30585 [Chara braunii]|eukprot:GBG80218.1 hypothetical protein CBR_g30585 [Chara braunii]